MKQKKSVLKSAILCLLLFVMTFSFSTLSADAARGVSLGIFYPYSDSGSLGYYSGSHEYIYAFQEEPDIQISFGGSNTFDFGGSYPARNVFLADSAILDPTNTNLEFSISGFTPISINDPGLPAYAAEVSLAKAYFSESGVQGIFEDEMGAIVIPQAQAAALQDQTLYYAYTRHFGNNSGRGFDSCIYFRIYGAVLENADRVAYRSISYQLVEPEIGLEVTKTLVAPNNSEVELGDTVTFKVTIKNTSHIWLENVILEDTLFTSSVSNIEVDGNPANLNSAGKLELGNMAGDITGKQNGREIVVTYEYTVSASDAVENNGVKTITNIATASGTTPAKSYDQEEDEKGNYPYTGPDLAVVKPLTDDDSTVLTLGTGEIEESSITPIPSESSTPDESSEPSWPSESSWASTPDESSDPDESSIQSESSDPDGSVDLDASSSGSETTVNPDTSPRTGDQGYLPGVLFGIVISAAILFVLLKNKKTPKEIK